MSIRNSRFFIIVMMVLIIVSQSVASAAVSYSMAKGSSTMAMNGDNRSCHDEEGLVIDDKDDGSLVDQALDVASNGSDNCCDTDCHCPSGLCSSAALPLNNMPNVRSNTLSQNIEYPSQWVVSQYPSSLYRPPISL